MKVYDGSAWLAAYASLSGALLVANNLSDVNNASASRTNLGLEIGTNVQAYSAILAATTASYTTALNSKLNGIEAGATADQTASEIKTAYESNSNTNAFTYAEKTKLSGVEAGANVTDAGNVDPLVDSHLNTSTASSGEYLSWNGSDYDKVAIN